MPKQDSIWVGAEIPVMKPFRKQNVVWGFFFAAFLSGCATLGDLQSVQQDSGNSTREVLKLQRNIAESNAEVKKLSSKIEAQVKKQNDLQQQISTLSAETKSHFTNFGKQVESSGQPMRQSQAALAARVDKLQSELQNLTRRFEESKYFAEKAFQETRNVREGYQARLEDLGKRVTALNKTLNDFETKQGEGARAAVKSKAEPEEQNSTPANPQSKAPQTPPPAPPMKVAEKPKPASGPEESFNRSYDLFNGGDIEGAKAGFQGFLKVHGKSKYAEKAHFWLAECYFRQKKFDDAILEYDEVVKKFPKGNKVPDALLRQGLAFIEIRNTASAKLILKEVIRRFPKSNQAAQARKKLNKI